MNILKLNPINSIILVFLIFGMMSACKKIIPGPAVHVSASISCALVDSLGRELVNPQHPEIFDWRKIQVFDLIDGKKVKRKPKVDAKPDNEISFDFDTLSENGHYLIRLSLASWDDIWDKVKERTRVVQWNEFSSDTFHTTFDTSPPNYEMDKIEYNGKDYFFYVKDHLYCFEVDSALIEQDSTCALKIVIKL